MSMTGPTTLTESAAPAEAGAATANLSVDGTSGPVGGAGAAGVSAAMQAFGKGLSKQQAPTLPQEHIDAFHMMFGPTTPQTQMPQIQQTQALAPIVAPPPAAPPMAAVSDRRAKHSIAGGAHRLDTFLEALARRS